MERKLERVRGVGLHFVKSLEHIEHVVERNVDGAVTKARTFSGAWAGIFPRASSRQWTISCWPKAYAASSARSIGLVRHSENGRGAWLSDINALPYAHSSSPGTASLRLQRIASTRSPFGPRRCCRRMP